MSRQNDIWQRKPAGLVAGWDFSGERVTSPTGHTGTLTNGASISGRSLLLDGVDDYLSIPDAPEFSFTNGSGTDLPASVVIWFKTTAPTTRQFIISKRTLSTYEWQFEYRATAGAGLEVVLLNPTATASLSRYDAGRTLTSGQWYCAAFTYSGSENAAGLKIYQDAVQVDDTTAGSGYTGMSNTTNPVSIGCLPTANLFPLAGAVGTTLIFNRALTQPEIAQIYHAGQARIALGGTP